MLSWGLTEYISSTTHIVNNIDIIIRIIPTTHK